MTADPKRGELMLVGVMDPSGAPQTVNRLPMLMMGRKESGVAAAPREGSADVIGVLMGWEEWWSPAATINLSAHMPMHRRAYTAAGHAC